MKCIGKITIVRAAMKQIIDKPRPEINTQFGIDAGETSFPITMHF